MLNEKEYRCLNKQEMQIVSNHFIINKENGTYYFDNDTMIGFADVYFFDHSDFVWISYIEKFTFIKGDGLRIIEHIKSKHGIVRLKPSEKNIGSKKLENYYLRVGFAKIDDEQPPTMEF